MVQHGAFWDLVSQEVDVYPGDLSVSQTNIIMFDDEREVLTDIFLCGTG